MISDDGLLWIEPANEATPVPVIDRLTRKMCAAFRNLRPFAASGGVHVCICGAMCDSGVYELPNGDNTHSLCIHYVAHHRSEVPEKQLVKIEAFSTGEAEPTYYELHGPEPTLEQVITLDAYQHVFQDFDAQLLAIRQMIRDAAAKEDWETACQLSDVPILNARLSALRQARIQYMTDRFHALEEPSIKMRWAVTLVYQNAANREVIDYLKSILESKEQSQTLSHRLGKDFARFVESLLASGSAKPEFNT